MVYDDRDLRWDLSWIIKLFEMVGAAKNIANLLKKF